MSNNLSLPTSSKDLQVQAHSLVQESTRWFHDIQDNWVTILIAIGVAVVVFFGLHLVRGWGMRLCRRSEGTANWYAILGRAVARTGNFFILMTAIRLVIGYLDAPPMLFSTAAFLFTVAAVFQAAIWVREVIFGVVEYRTSTEEYQGSTLTSALSLIRLLVTLTLFAIALVVVLSNVGVNVTGLVAGLGVGGIAIGLAAQGIFADLFAALAIIFDKPFRLGDKVKYGQTSGVVERIGLKSTRIRSFTGETHVIANKQLLDKEIQNISDREHVRIELAIGVAYQTAPDLLAGIPDILTGIVEAEKASVARASFERFGPSSIDLILQFDIPGDDWPTAHATRDRVIVAILRRFAAEGISIPYPTQTTFTADPSGKLIAPYPEVQPVIRMDKEKHEP